MFATKYYLNTNAAGSSSVYGSLGRWELTFDPAYVTQYTNSIIWLQVANNPTAQAFNVFMSMNFGIVDIL